ncbi:hypothetical protein LIA77_01097 [Sarocladium implicatum]|nr:hypothetical protein LIA77_01097 [Sarocladium implicatum]
MSARYAALALDDDDTKLAVSSPDNSTPTSTSPDHIHYSSLAEHTLTPLSLVDDAFAASAGSDAAKAAVDNRFVGGRGATTATGTPSNSHPLSTLTAAMAPGNETSDSHGFLQQNPESTSSSDASIKPNTFAASLDNQGHNSSDIAQSSHQGSLSPRNVPDTVAENNTGPETADIPVRPLRTGSVRHDTRLAHPKPINLTTSTSTGSLPEPATDASSRLGAPVGNVAQLEATAEQLSMTSSIDHAIRDLHGELKRSDSRRSSILAANARTSPVAEEHHLSGLKRGLSNASSIVSTNIAARQGGYSPAGFIMSPTNSLTGRLRSGSKNSTGRPDFDPESILLRHGPGKASVRSVRSTKMSLAEISESEPVALDKNAMDQADAAPPLEDDPDETLRLPEDDMPNTDAFHQMMGDNEVDFGGPVDLGLGSADEPQRPMSSRSNNTFQQAQDAFVDFDGVHWEPDEELDAPIEEEVPPPRFAMRPERPQSYIDPLSGQQMMWYPARVPAMLNLPPKLSSHKPRLAQRENRRSQILSAMVQSDYESLAEHKHRHSAMADLNRGGRMPKRDSWLPDPLAGQRESFIGLDSDHFRDPEADPPAPAGEDMGAQDAHSDTPPDHLRRPQRLSRMAPEQRQSSMPQTDALPPQLRASAFFDLPAAAPQVEVKDGSAMATLDSILDAAAVAPASAFTDHTIAGRLGNEVYGKEKKRRPQSSAISLGQLSPPAEPKKRSSFMWLGNRKSSHGSEKNDNLATAPIEDHSAQSDDERSRLAESVDGQSVIHIPAEAAEAEDEDSEEGDGYQGPPTTLLAELQLRKQQQKQRTQPLSRAFPNGMHATLLEMDAVAEAQRKERKGKRVNLAWEDPDAHYDQNGSDDDDVPLAIIAAKQQGAKNMADVDRPLGLMERRELEENEPLSQRRARLQGVGTRSLAQLHQRQQSTLSLAPAPRPGGSRSPSRAGLTPEPDANVEFEEPEVEGETLGERKRRLVAKEEAEGRLPNTRPVSRAFSDELLSRFGEPEETSAPAPADTGEETLGQRRRRLQAEREARDREMSYGKLTGRPIAKRNSRLSMSDVLNAYPKTDTDPSPAAQRPQPLQTLSSQIVDRRGAFRGGIYNNNNGGVRPMQSTPSLHTQGMMYGGATPSMFGGYGAPMQQQPSFNGMMNPMGGYNAMGGYGAAPAMSMYGGGMMQPGMPVQMPANGGSMDRVEQWRQGIS